MNKKIAFIVAIFLLVMAGAIFTVKASDSYQNVNLEYVESAYFGDMDEGTGGEGMIGASGDSNFTNVVTSGDITIGGVTYKAVTGSCADATTTPIAAANPFSSGTSSIIYFQYDSTGVATTSYDMDCGVAADAYTSADDLIDGITVATSTQKFQMNPYGTNGVAHVNVDVGEYVTCTLTPIQAAGITNSGNTYTCAYKAIFVQ